MSGARFGTDGIRGRAGCPPLDARTVLEIGQALGAWVKERGGPLKVVIGRDPRPSGPAIETALAAGLSSVGCDISLLGVIPTPAVAHATLTSEAAAGVVISASHNPSPDNGIKIFGADGYKLREEEEGDLERRLLGPSPQAPPERWGQIQHIAAAEAYISHLLEALDGLTLEGMTIAFDGANGAGALIGPEVLKRAGARVISLNTASDGDSINNGCGALHPEGLAEAVVSHGADLGVALDGDGDRCMLVDELGVIVDGDPTLAIWGRSLLERGELPGRAVVATVMSNLGLELYFNALGITLVRTNVGDKYVARQMRAQGARLGGEQSGHILDLSHSTTGDGLLTALSVARIMANANAPLSALCGGFRRLPQVLHNVRVAERRPLEAMPTVTAAITAAEAALGEEGRVLVRYSGTELLGRVMIEGPELPTIQRLAAAIGDAIAEQVGA